MENESAGHDKIKNILSVLCHTFCVMTFDEDCLFIIAVQKVN